MSPADVCRQSCLDVARWLLSRDVKFQRLYLGENFDTVIYNAGYLVFRDDDRNRSSAVVLLAAPVSVPLLPSPSVAAIYDDAPSLDLLNALDEIARDVDVDSLSDEDAVDFLRELDWRDFWREQYRRYGR